MPLTDPDFVEFVAAQQATLTRVARGICLNWSDADEVVQECLVRVGMRWRRLIRSGEPLGYARTVLIRLAIDQARARQREILFVGKGVPPTQQEDRHWVEEDGWIRDALNLLTPQQRAAVALRFLADRSDAEIATHLGCTESTVRSHISRGVDRLRALVLDTQEEQ